MNEDSSKKKRFEISPLFNPRSTVFPANQDDQALKSSLTWFVEIEPEETNSISESAFLAYFDVFYSSGENKKDGYSDEECAMIKKMIEEQRPIYQTELRKQQKIFNLKQKMREKLARDEETPLQQLNAKFEALQKEHIRLKEELAELHRDKEELAELKPKLTNQAVELLRVKGELIGLKSELASQAAELSKAKSELEKEQLARTELEDNLLVMKEELATDLDYDFWELAEEQKCLREEAARFKASLEASLEERYAAWVVEAKKKLELEREQVKNQVEVKKSRFFKWCQSKKNNS